VARQGCGSGHERDQGAPGLCSINKGLQHMLDSQTPAAVDSRLRRLATRNGYRLYKSRERTWHINNQGGYRIVDPDRNLCVAGVNFDLDPGDVEAFFVD